MQYDDNAKEHAQFRGDSEGTRVIHFYNNVLVKIESFKQKNKE